MPELRRSSRLQSNEEPASKKAKSEPAKKPKKETKKRKEPEPEPKVTKKAKSEPKKEPKEPKASKELEIGDPIPKITLLDEDENEVNLGDIKTKFLVIFAYPKASTPGCTRQVCGFQTNNAFFAKSNTTVFGLSADKPKSQKNFVVKQKLKYPLLSDPSRDLIGLLGAKKSPTGIKRSHWIFVNGKLEVKRIQISPEESIKSAKEYVEKKLKSK